MILKLNMKNKFVLGALLALSLSANATDNPVIMTINGKDVKLSEQQTTIGKGVS